VGWLASHLAVCGFAGAATRCKAECFSSLNLYKSLKEALTRSIKIKVSIQNHLERQSQAKGK
jgi:hypothetical protein